MIAQSFGRRVTRHSVSLMALALFAVNAQALPFLILKATAPNATVLEGERGGVPVTLDYTVSLSAISVVPVTVLFATQPQTSPSFPAVNGTSCPSSDAGRVQPQADFVAKSVQLVIPANTLQFPGTVSVAICPDDQVERAEKLIVLLTTSDPSVAVCFSECQSIATIADDDGPPSASAASVTVREPLSGSRTATFTASLSHPHPGFEVTLDWRTLDGTARAVSGACQVAGTSGFPDYLGGSGTLRFPSGVTTATFPVSICADSLSESTETYSVVLSNATNSTVATGSILNFVLPVLGTFTLDPEGADLQVRDWLTYRFGWTLTTGVWRDLKSMDVRFRQRGTRHVPLWIRWVESTNTFQLCRGSGSDSGEDEDRPENVRCGPAMAAGSAAILEAPLARFDLSGARAAGSGPTGPSVVLDLPVSFLKGAANNQFYDVEVAAENDAGVRDDFLPAGVLQVERAPRAR